MARNGSLSSAASASFSACPRACHQGTYVSVNGPARWPLHEERWSVARGWAGNDALSCDK